MRDLVFWLWPGILLVAQDTTGKIVGIVSDPSGGVVAGATVTVTNTGTEVARQTSTDKQGYYQVLELPIGRYEVAAEATGFSRMVVAAKNPLEINQTLRIDVTLEVGAVKDMVTVEGGASAVETENSTIGATVSGSAIYELPLNGRNTLDLLATQPGVTPKNVRCAAAGGRIQHRRRTLRFGDVPARWRLEQPPDQQRHRDQPESRRGGRIPRAAEQLRGGIRPQRRRHREHGDQERHQLACTARLSTICATKTWMPIPSSTTSRASRGRF